jgi:hypothetical protein
MHAVHERAPSLYMHSMTAPLRWFNERATRRPSWRERGLYVLLAVALPAAVWEDRGAVVGIVAGLVYAPMLLLGAFAHDWLLSRSARTNREERWFAWPLSTLPLLALTFLAVALITEWSLGVCLLAGVAAWVLFTAFVLLKRQRVR